MLVCGSGIVSSTLVAPTVEEILRESPYNCELIKGGLGDLKDKINQIDLLLTTITLPKDIEQVGVPVVSVTGLFNGEEEKIKRDILEKLDGQYS
jgi:galactitol-specific phosphotransferase system IIB component